MKKFVQILAILLIALPAVCQDRADVEPIYQCWDNAGTQVTLIRIDVNVVGEGVPLFSKWYDGAGVEQTPNAADLTNGTCVGVTVTDDYEIVVSCDYNETTEAGTSFIRIVKIDSDGVITSSTVDMTGAIYTPVNTVYNEPCSLKEETVEQEDIELLDKECYEADSVAYCTVCVTAYGTSNQSDIEVNGYVDSIFDYTGALMTLPNYPYYYRRDNGASPDDRVQLQLDLSAYYTAQGWTHTPYPANSINMCVGGTDKYISRNTTVLERNNPTDTLYNSHNATPFNCDTVPGGATYEVYRDQTGEIAVVIDTEDSRVLKELPDGARRVECCSTCDLVEEEDCEVQNKTNTYVVTNAVQTFAAGTYHSIAIWHTDGAMRMTVDNNQPVDFLENRNYTSSDRSSDDCKYKQSTYIIDTSINGGGQVLVKTTY